MSTRNQDRDRGYIDVLAHHLNRRQAAKIRDTSNVTTLVVKRKSGITYWIRGVDNGVWVYAKGAGGGYAWDRIIDHTGLSTLLDDFDDYHVLHNYQDVPKRIRDGPNGGDTQ